MGLFGKKPEYVHTPYVAPPTRQAPGPSMDQTIHNAEMRTGNLDARIAAVDSDIANFKREMQRSRPGSSAYNMYKRRALHAMRQKKSLEGRASMSANAAFNLEQVRDASHMQADNIAMVQGLKTASEDLRQAQGAIDLDEVEDLRDDVQEALADVNEVGDVLGRSYDVDNVDHAELEAELDELEEESMAYPTGEATNAPYLRPAAVETPQQIAAPPPQMHQNYAPASYAPPNAQGMPANRY